MSEVLVSNKLALYPFGCNNWAEFMSHCKRYKRKNFRFTVVDKDGRLEHFYLGAVVLDGSGQRFSTDCLKIEKLERPGSAPAFYVPAANAMAFGIDERNPDNSARIINAEFDVDNGDFSVLIYKALIEKFWSIDGDFGCENLENYLLHKDHLLTLARALEFVKQLRKGLDQDLEPSYVLKRTLDVAEDLKKVGAKIEERERALKKEWQQLGDLEVRIHDVVGW